MRVHLVDGTYELFRAFFGAPAAQAEDGQEVGATRSLMRSMLSLLRQPEVSHVAAAFDTVIESFRNDMFDGYKTGAGIDPLLHSQFPLAEQGLAAMGIVIWPMVEFEADDAIATAAARFGAMAEVDQVVMCTPDKDMAQCVEGQRIVSYDRRRDITLDAAGVLQKFGVRPASIPDWLALVGDKADGIPGIARWGAKSSATVLRHYRHIEAIPDDAADWEVQPRGAKSLALQLAAQRPQAMLYRRLATLRRDVPLPDTLDDLRWRGAHREALNDVCDRIGLRGSFRSRMLRWRRD
ncbi:MAG TPA: flap endonuclease [Sorangium sp.]|nr:flap endonuclease [Sorangium sp.]